MSEVTQVGEDRSWMQDDVLSTPELTVPPPQPDAHQATINGVELVRFDSGSAGIKVNLQSLDNPNIETNAMIFLPKMFVEDIHVNPETLPEEEGNNQRFSYRTGISNSKGTATVQQLREIAYKDYQRNSASVGITSAPENIDEYVDALNKILTGVELVFFRRPEKNEDNPQFDGQLRVKGFYSKSIVGNPKFLKKYRKAWEQTE